MKSRILLCLAGAFLAFTSYAQDPIEKLKDRRPQTSARVANTAVQERNWIIGASIANIGANFENDIFSFGVNPRAGYFLSDNAALGTEVQLQYDVFDGDNIFRWALTPFVRYYFPEGASPTSRWFGEAVLGIGGSDVANNPEDTGLDVVYGLRAGYAHFVAENVAIEGILGWTESDADVSVGFGQTGLNFAVGLQVYIPSRMNVDDDN